MRDADGFFLNHTLKALNIPFIKVILPGRFTCGGTEGELVVAHGCRKRKKANMWYGRGNRGGSWPPAFPTLFEISQSWLMSDFKVDLV